MPLFHRGDSCCASKGMILEYLILKCFDWEVVLYLLDRNSPPYWGAVNALINKHWRNLCFWLLTCVYTVQWAPQVALVVKNPPADAGDVRDGSTRGWGRSPGGGPGNPLQYPCLENPKDRGVWWETVHRVAKSQAWLEPFCTHASQTGCPYLYKNLRARTANKLRDYAQHCPKRFNVF